MDNENIKQKVKGILGVILKPIMSILLGLKQTFVTLFLNKLTIIIVGLIIGFVVGARMHEVGFLAGMFGKTLKGATVTLSGPCKMNSNTRVLAEDEVKITGEEDGVITGVVRKTREVVTCDPKIVAIDKLPLLANIKKSPAPIPELTALKVDVKEPEWKKLIQKTLVMSGSCMSQMGKEIPPFTDEKVDVTDVQLAKDAKEGDDSQFVITGIKKSDKIAIVCNSTAVKYSLYVEKAEAPVQMDIPVVEKPHSYIGETILVTSTCFPDPRLPKHKVDRKVAFYPLVNSPVQVTEENLDANGKIKKIAGAALEFGQMIVCDASKFPFTSKPYDADSMKLQKLHPSEKGMESEDAAPVAPAAGSAQVAPVAPAAGADSVKAVVGDATKKNPLLGQ